MTEDKSLESRDGFGPRLRRWFGIVATRIARLAGEPAAFIGAVTLIMVWAALGPALGYSDAWQLTVNTATTIITFLMVFLIQNSQNRDAAAVQIKLDELIRASENARNALLDLEDMTEDQLMMLLERYRAAGRSARDSGDAETEGGGRPEVAITFEPERTRSAGKSKGPGEN
jgi:low affinity Fe/Cu permease